MTADPAMVDQMLKEKVPKYKKLKEDCGKFLMAREQVCAAEPQSPDCQKLIQVSFDCVARSLCAKTYKSYGECLMKNQQNPDKCEKQKKAFQKCNKKFSDECDAAITKAGLKN
eukprot:TRINITY_DN26007_c0_g1_i1.p1 TRINITY_DN26007_c0_g1~~TRINITY_DN26007_c0_g1_i1.p1  ORF type:complete len:121 (+),score=37.54 TRINITY_DN26007_c0_g1_i1:26-364(+)